MLMVEALRLSDGMVGTGSSLVVKFSHDTNTPVVMRSDNLRQIVNISPQRLEKLPRMAYWEDGRTLVILFMAAGKGEQNQVKSTDIVVTFLEPKGT